MQRAGFTYKTRSVFANDKFVKLMQDGRERYLRSEIMLLLIYSLISKERRIIIGKASVDDEMSSQDK